MRTRAIASVKVKTQIGAKALAQVAAADFLPR